MTFPKVKGTIIQMIVHIVTMLQITSNGLIASMTGTIIVNICIHQSF
jgi:hypothetical protein